MFVTATFYGLQKQKRAAVPATAVVHLHDRDWVYVPVENNQFRQTAVVGGDMLPGNMQEIISGITPGQRVVINALAFQTTVAEQ
jgi:cobalt-zinc-cadmium efflux system membrane fusion protein